MKRCLAAAVALALALVTAASAELPFKSISVTQTSQTWYFRPAEAVGLCNFGSDAVYFRLFRDEEARS